MRIFLIAALFAISYAQTVSPALNYGMYASENSDNSDSNDLERWNPGMVGASEDSDNSGAYEGNFLKKSEETWRNNKGELEMEKTTYKKTNKKTFNGHNDKKRSVKPSGLSNDNFSAGDGCSGKAKGWPCNDGNANTINDECNGSGNCIGTNWDSLSCKSELDSDCGSRDGSWDETCTSTNCVGCSECKGLINSGIPDTFFTTSGFCEFLTAGKMNAQCIGPYGDGYPGCQITMLKSARVLPMEPQDWNHATIKFPGSSSYVDFSADSSPDLSKIPKIIYKGETFQSDKSNIFWMLCFQALDEPLLPPKQDCKYESSCSAGYYQPLSLDIPFRHKGYDCGSFIWEEDCVYCCELKDDIFYKIGNDCASDSKYEITSYQDCDTFAETVAHTKMWLLTASDSWPNSPKGCIYDGSNTYWNSNGGGTSGSYESVCIMKTSLLPIGATLNSYNSIGFVTSWQVQYPLACIGFISVIWKASSIFKRPSTYEEVP